MEHKKIKVKSGIVHYWIDRAEKSQSCTVFSHGVTADHSKQITPQVYRSFFANTLDLSTLPSYTAANLPMYAICGSKEVKDMKTSLDLLAENPHCKPMVLQKANNDFPMRNADELNMILAEVFTKHTHDQQCSL